jgi:tripartite-type tricarboxylate transporter receptor subunit TctC
MQESGVPGFDISNWFAYLAPAGTQAEVVAKLHGEITRALKLPDVREKLAAVGAEVAASSTDELTQFIRSESDKYAKLVKASGAKGTD